MRESEKSKLNKSSVRLDIYPKKSPGKSPGKSAVARPGKGILDPMNAMSAETMARFVPPKAKTEMLQTIAFLDEMSDELEGAIDLSAPNPKLRIVLSLMRGHLEGKVITATSLIGMSRVPYATATRRLKEMMDAGLIEQRPRTKTGKSYSMHPAGRMVTTVQPRATPLRQPLWRDGHARRCGGLLFRRLVYEREIHPAATGSCRTVEAAGRRARVGARRSNLYGDGQSQTPV
jgi:predicted transcriptional regulator